jgi:hypothetical protein
MNTPENLYSFLENIKGRSRDIVIDELDVDMLARFVKGDIKEFEGIDKRAIEELKQSYGVGLNSEETWMLYLGSCSLAWKRPEKTSREGFLSGGFVFNDIRDVYKFDTPFWEKSFNKLKKFGEERLIEMDKLHDLRWIESPTIPSEAIYTPQFGCARYAKGKLPGEFFFYDSGLLYPLPFKSLDEYTDALVSGATVRCWQYFHISPELVIKKNRGLKYVTWSLHLDSHLEEGLNVLEYKEDSRVDRLDLINEYLERCVRLLPQSFPFIDFSHHKKYYEDFLKEYSKPGTE